MIKIGFGGGCHWCTEAVFQALRGVTSVAQGFIAAPPPHDSFSEAELVAFDPDVIPLSVLINVHLCTHASTSPHKMRGKYRSAIYLDGTPEAQVRAVLDAAQPDFDAPLITSVLPLVAFRASPAQFQNYYQTDAARPFCTTYIDPKLAKIRKEFAAFAR